MAAKHTPSILLWLCGAGAAFSFVLLFHNFGLAIFPECQLVIAPEAIQPLDEGGTRPGYVFAFNASEPDRPQNQRSRVRLLENGLEAGPKILLGPHMGPLYSGRWLHSPGFIIFSTSDNSDPRTNGRTYTLFYSPFYSAEAGLLAASAFGSAVFGLYWTTRKRIASGSPPSPMRSLWRRHLFGTTMLFVVGLYFNTGTLAPYANTFIPKLDPATGYLYNFDHQVFRVLYDFVNGTERSVWDQALLLRRILFPVLAWPFMRLAGFELGGVIASLAFNLIGFIVSVHLIRRQIGERGAQFAAWLLALYPGAAYWGGLPYTYVMIFPCSMLLMLGLMELSATDRSRSIAFISVSMGIAYLAYDLAVFFIPATLLSLVWQRRWRAAVVATALQAAPTILWIVSLKIVFAQSPANSNTTPFSVVVHSYFNPGNLAAWWEVAAHAPDTGWDIFFGSNFLFLPALFLAVLAFNPITSRLKLSVPEGALLVATLALFLFSNLAPAYDAPWTLRGAWISRLYQPMFPALILFISRWWQHLPPLNWPTSILIGTIVLGAMAGNALIIFGPISANWLHVSSNAFYRFYTHSDQVWRQPYESNLKEFGRRPIGFPNPRP